MLLFLGVNQFHILNGILNMENVKILPHKTPKNNEKAFSGHFHFAYFSTKSSLAVILRGQPSFNN